MAVNVANHWGRKVFAGLVLGLPLGFGVVASFAWFTPGDMTEQGKVMLTIWVVALVWLVSLSTCFSFANGNRAIGMMLAANLVVYALFFGLKAVV